MSRAFSFKRFARTRASRKASSWGIGLLAMSTALNAQSTSWRLVVNSDDGQIAFYADSTSVAIHGRLRNVRLLYDYAQTQQNPDTLERHLSTIELASVDCESRRIAPVQSTNYAGHKGAGALVSKSMSVPNEQLRYVTAAADSLDDKVVKYVCAIGDSSQHKQR
jgi:hypothetical protein